MTSKSAARANDGGEVNPKIDPAPNSNTEKGPDDWVSGGELDDLDDLTGDRLFRREIIDGDIRSLARICDRGSGAHPGVAASNKRIAASKSTVPR